VLLRVWKQPKTNGLPVYPISRSLMLSVDLSFLKPSADKTAPLAPTVFHLELPRHGNGHSPARIFVRKVGAKYQTEKSPDFQANLASTAASLNSARFVQLPASQMKRKAFVTLSPFDRGLLLGRGAFLF
jgi:hypothetical protein